MLATTSGSCCPWLHPLAQPWWEGSGSSHKEILSLPWKPCGAGRKEGRRRLGTSILQPRRRCRCKSSRGGLAQGSQLQQGGMGMQGRGHFVLRTWLCGDSLFCVRAELDARDAMCPAVHLPVPKVLSRPPARPWHQEGPREADLGPLRVTALILVVFGCPSPSQRWGPIGTGGQPCSQPRLNPCPLLPGPRVRSSSKGLLFHQLPEPAQSPGSGSGQIHRASSKELPGPWQSAGGHKTQTQAKACDYSVLPGGDVAMTCTSQVSLQQPLSPPVREEWPVSCL